MERALTLIRSSVGRKFLIAITGLILFGFLIGHLAGNLLLFAGQETYNEYAAGLKANLPLLWGVRTTLLVSLVVHVTLTMQLARQNASARSARYARPRQDQMTSYAALTMVLTGPIILLYLLFHLAHFTAPGLPIGGTFSHTDVYTNAVQSFRVPWVSAIYMGANVLVGIHLQHGIWSALQTVGANHPSFNKVRRHISVGLAVALAGGNVFIPIAVMTNLIGANV